MVHGGKGQLTGFADLIELLVVHRDPHAPGLFRDDHQRARIWLSRVLDQPSLEVLVEGRFHFFGRNRVYAMGPRSYRSTALRNRDLEGHQGAAPKSVFEVEKTSGNSQSASPSCSMARGVQPGSRKSNAISRRWGGSRAQMRKNEEH